MDSEAKKKFRSVGGGRKVGALEVREVLFQWFVTITEDSLSFTS